MYKRAIPNALLTGLLGGAGGGIHGYLTADKGHEAEDAARGIAIGGAGGALAGSLGHFIGSRIGTVAEKAVASEGGKATQLLLPAHVEPKLLESATRAVRQRAVPKHIRDLVKSNDAGRTELFKRKVRTMGDLKTMQADIEHALSGDHTLLMTGLHKARLADAKRQLAETERLMRSYRK